MKKGISTSILVAEEVKKHIFKEFQPLDYSVNFGGKDEPIEIVIKTTEENQGFEVVTPYTFNEEDIKEMVEEVLRIRGVNGTNLTIELGHEPGDFNEPMDYGKIVFKGVKFEWLENTSDKIIKEYKVGQ